MWTQTEESSPVRQLLLDLIVWNASEHEMGMFAREYPADFSARLLQMCMARLKVSFTAEGRSPRAKGKASYHVASVKMEEHAFLGWGEPALRMRTWRGDGAAEDSFRAREVAGFAFLHGLH